MPKYTTAVAPVDTLKEAFDNLNQLVARMRIALDAIAEAEGAEKCPYCGEWTTEPLIDIEDLDEYGTSWGVNYFCRKCEPGRSN